MNFWFLTECYVKEGKSHAQALAGTFGQVDNAEALGMDSVWMVEQHFRPWASSLPSLMLMASAIAMRTQRMRIGLAVQVLPLSNTLRSAEEACMMGPNQPWPVRLWSRAQRYHQVLQWLYRPV